MPGSNILDKHEYICLKIGNLCSLNNRSTTAFSVYSYEIFYISFQPHDMNILAENYFDFSALLVNYLLQAIDGH